MTLDKVRVPLVTKPSSIWTEVGFYTSLGFIVPAGVLAGAAIGWLLDHWLRTSPVLTMILGFLGTAAGLTEVLKILGRAEKDADGNNSNSRPGSS